jgi:uncharacterized protein involved in response to NO
MIVNIDFPPKNPVGKFALLHLGFRPFFIGASIFALLAIFIWMGLYSFGWPISFGQVSPMMWHGHEMIFGYSLAVVAGFLLTAIKNWTGRQTLHGYPLLLLFLIWLVARILPFFGEWVPLVMIAVIDNLFIFLLSVSVLSPLIKAKQWKSVALASTVFWLMISNIVYYLGLFGVVVYGQYYGLYAGLYLILVLIFIMGRRVMPFFIEKGVGYPVKLKNWTWIDNSFLPVFLLFCIADLSQIHAYLTAGLAGLLAVMLSIRIVSWHTLGLWKKPLLWSLYLGHLFILFGFILKILVVFGGVSVYLAIHAFAFGGIGLTTISMMARVSLGHTGRNVLAPPPSLFWIVALITCGAIVRVVFPLIDMSYYLVWITVSQFFWILAFSGFLYFYFPMLIYPRTDGHYG